MRLSAYSRQSHLGALSGATRQVTRLAQLGLDLVQPAAVEDRVEVGAQIPAADLPPRERPPQLADPLNHAGPGLDQGKLSPPGC